MQSDSITDALHRLAGAANTRERRRELVGVLIAPIAQRAHGLASLLDRWGVPPGATAVAANPYLTIAEPTYPEVLRAIPDPPAVLFHAGDIGCLHATCIAVVGSRRAAASSLAVAHDMALEFARAGIVVVSGLARGVDGAAHRGALAGNGRTVAVLGGGLDRPYPPQHRALFHEVCAQGVALSEYPPGATPHPSHFPQRNRLISGLSRAVVVVEAAERSGSLGTARQALEQGRDVLVVPGAVVGGRFAGSHALIRDGATLVESAADVLAAVGIDLAPAAAQATAVSEPLLDALASEPTTIDELVRTTGMDAQEVRRRLVGLELSGVVVTSARGYSRVR